MNTKKFLVGLFAFVLILLPSATFAQTTINYQPRTTGEMIAYLYGRIAQLVEIRDMLSEQGGNSGQTSSAFDFVTIETHSATERTVTTAVLRGEVNLFGEATAKAWFEYSQDEGFLDQKTRQTRVNDVYGRTVRTKITGLEEDERYYFRIVALDDNEVVTYGSVFSFRTDEAD